MKSFKAVKSVYTAFKKLSDKGISSDVMKVTSRITKEEEKMMMELINKYKMFHAVLWKDEDKSPRITFIVQGGTNGREGSIKNSLLEVYNLLYELDNEDKVKWSQVLDVYIDNADDLYDFLITLELKKERSIRI
jgi:DNA polymerase III delta prime subunit